MRLSCKTPIEQLLANLIDKRCKIEQLAQLLRNCELYEALSVLITGKFTFAYIIMLYIQSKY